MHRGEVAVVAMGTKILPSETRTIMAEPCSVVNFAVVVAAASVVVALLFVCSSIPVRREAAFAIPASSKERNPADAFVCTATSVA